MICFVQAIRVIESLKVKVEERGPISAYVSFSELGHVVTPVTSFHNRFDLAQNKYDDMPPIRKILYSWHALIGPT